MWRCILARGHCEVRVSHSGVVHFDTGDNLVAVNGSVLYSRCPGRTADTTREVMLTVGELAKLTPYRRKIIEAYERTVTE